MSRTKNRKNIHSQVPGTRVGPGWLQRILGCVKYKSPISGISLELTRKEAGKKIVRLINANLQLSHRLYKLQNKLNDLRTHTREESCKLK